MGYRFGIGSYGRWVWDRVIWDIDLALGFMGQRFGIGFGGYTFGIGFYGI